MYGIEFCTSQCHRAFTQLEHFLASPVTSDFVWNIFFSGRIRSSTISCGWILLIPPTARDWWIEAWIVLVLSNYQVMIRFIVIRFWFYHIRKGRILPCSRRTKSSMQFPVSIPQHQSIGLLVLIWLPWDSITSICSWPLNLEAAEDGWGRRRALQSLLDALQHDRGYTQGFVPPFVRGRMAPPSRPFTECGTNPCSIISEICRSIVRCYRSLVSQGTVQAAFSHV